MERFPSLPDFPHNVARQAKQKLPKERVSKFGPELIIESTCVRIAFINTPLQRAGGYGVIAASRFSGFPAPQKPLKRLKSLYYFAKMLLATQSQSR
jgi:hypothetical protein